MEGNSSGTSSTAIVVEETDTSDGIVGFLVGFGFLVGRVTI